MNKFLIFILLQFSVNSIAHEDTRWVEIGNGTYEHGFLYPYKIKLYVPFGVRNMDYIKEGLFPMKFNISWLPNDFSKQEVDKLFFEQLEKKYKSKESFKLSKNIISMFLHKLKATKRHDEWVFTYYPDEGSRLFIDGEKIHHLVGAELNRALIQSWLDHSPVLTSNLFRRLIKVQ